MGRLEDDFRELRQRWFSRVIADRGPEREWEGQQREAERIRRNDEMRQVYDRQTEDIIAGESFPVAPACPADFIGM